jgi:hypothetical protein
MMRKPVNFGRSKQYPGQMTFTPVATKSQKPRQAHLVPILQLVLVCAMMPGASLGERIMPVGSLFLCLFSTSRGEGKDQHERRFQPGGVMA